MIRCFTRAERNGMHVIFPVEGRMKHDCMVVNDTVKFVYDRLAAGLDIAALTAEFVDRARRLKAAGTEANGAPAPVEDPAVEAQKTRFDLYRILLSFKDRQICDYDFQAIAGLLPQSRALRGATQVMPLCLLDETSAFIKEAMAAWSPPAAADGAEGNGAGANGGGSPAGVTGPAGAPGVFYSLPTPDRFGVGGGVYFDKEQMLRRHLDQTEVYFVGADEAGRVEACTAVRGLPYQPLSLVIFFVVARAETPDAFEERVGRHLARLCGLLQVTSLSAKIRFQHSPGLAYTPAGFGEMIGELGFRRTFRLPDELAPGKELVAYDRVLF